MKFNKQHLLEKLTAELHHQLATVNSLFVEADEELLQKASNNGGWSIVQCLDHLNSYGLYYLPKINSAISKAGKDTGSYYQSGWLGDYFTKIMSPETGVRKHKAFKGHLPEPNLNSRDVIKEFLRQESLLLQYLETARSLDLSVRIPISISTWVTLKLGDIFRFVIAHNSRHLLQAERNVRIFEF